MAKQPQYQIEEISGAEYKTLEQMQDNIFAQLARLLVDAIRQNQELSGNQKRTEQGKKQPQR